LFEIKSIFSSIIYTVTGGLLACIFSWSKSKHCDSMVKVILL